MFKRKLLAPSLFYPEAAGSRFPLLYPKRP